MSDLVQQAFGFARPPLEKDAGSDPDATWKDPGRQQATERILETVAHRRHILVLGESGVGKTCVTRVLQDGLSPVSYRIQYIAHVTLAPRDFYRQICYSLGVQPKATPAAMFESIQRECIAAATEQRRHTVLVIDEAQLMPDSTLGHLHVLTNFHWDREPLLSLVLVGLPELHERLKLGIHRSLLTRIHTKVELQPTTPEQTTAYLRKRLQDAGARHDIFTADGLATLHELTGGLLRSVDVLALAALRLAAVDDKKLVDRTIVRRALHHTPLG